MGSASFDVEILLTHLELPDVVPQSILGKKRSRLSTPSSHVHVTVLHQIHLGTMTIEDQDYEIPKTFLVRYVLSLDI